MYNYNIPQNRNYYQNNYNNYTSSRTSYQPWNQTYPTTYYQTDDRFGGFLAPLLIGGVGGYLLGRPNYPQGPIPVFIPNHPQPYHPVPFY